MPVRRQLLRGIGWFLALAAAVYGLLLLIEVAGWLRGTGYIGSYTPLRGRISAVILGLTFVGGSAFTWRRLRSWSERPRWLLATASAVWVAALVPALWLPAPAEDFHSSICVPLAEAWRPVVVASAADLAFFEAGMHSGLPPSVHDKASLAALTRAQQARQRTPAYQRAYRYVFWAASGGSCAPRSRTALGASTMGLGLGAAGIALAVRRRRRA